MCVQGTHEEGGERAGEERREGMLRGSGVRGVCACAVGEERGHAEEEERGEGGGGARETGGGRRVQGVAVVVGGRRVAREERAALAGGW